MHVLVPAEQKRENNLTVVCLACFEARIKSHRQRVRTLLAFQVSALWPKSVCKSKDMMKPGLGGITLWKPSREELQATAKQGARSGLMLPCRHAVL